MFPLHQCITSGWWMPDLVYDANNGTPYYTATGDTFDGHDPLLGLPRFDMHYGQYELANMQEIMPNVYAGPIVPPPRNPTAPLYALPWVAPIESQPSVAQLRLGYRSNWVVPGAPGPMSAPVHVAPGPSGALRATPNASIFNAGPARAGRSFTQMPSHTDPTFAPPRTASQSIPRPMPYRFPSCQGRTNSHQVPGSAGFFLGRANANSHRTPSFQGRSSSYLGPVPVTRTHAHPKPRPSFENRNNSHQPPARTESQLGSGSLRLPSYQPKGGATGKAHSFRAGMTPARPSFGICAAPDPNNYRAYIRALHNYYRHTMPAQSGHYLDDLDDSVITAYLNCRGFDWKSESNRWLTIGPDAADLHGTDAISWSIPIPFLGLRYNVLEIVFPLNEASTRDLSNDLLRVLHVSLAAETRDALGALGPVPDDDLAESRRQVLLELERRLPHRSKPWCSTPKHSMAGNCDS